MKINWRLIRYIFGVLMLMEAGFMGLSTVVALYYRSTAGESDWWTLLLGTLVTAAAGFGTWYSSREHSNRITTREGFLVVSLSWLFFCFFSMIPLRLSGACGDISSAFLEAMSGFTTTGCTTILDLESQPHGILFWRHLMQWMGGLGIVVFSLALMPLIGAGATQVFGAETNGLAVDKLRPKIDETARRLWGIYVLMTTACAVLYGLGDMDWFDAICHSFSTLASGGFSTHSDSIGHFHSAYIEYVCIVFLFLTSVNFNLFYMLTKGHIGMIWKNEELRWFTGAVIGFTVLFMVLNTLTRLNGQMPAEELAALGDGSLECTLRASMFHTLSIISSAGYQAEYFDYNLWGTIFWLPTLLMMVMGGCSSSTAGGLKVVRFVVLIKNGRNQFLHALLPRSYSNVRLNGHPLSNDAVFKILAMLSIYLMLLVISIFILQCFGLNFETSIGTAVSALGNTGPALGDTGPAFTWAWLPAGAKWYLSFMMLVGRLEIFTVMVIFTPMFWKK